MSTCNISNCQTPATERNESIQRPRVISREDENGVRLQIALPGVRKEDLKLTLHEANLRIEATRSDVPGKSYGADIRLTSRFNGAQTTATLESGVLTLQVPVREEAKPRQIEVN